MIQRAEQSYDREYQDTYGTAKTSNVWLWAALAALALLALGVWYASGPATVGPQGSTKTTTTQEIAPAVTPAPAPAEATPAQQPAQNTQQQ
jgi:hypothetical protein